MYIERNNRQWERHARQISIRKHLRILFCAFLLCSLYFKVDYCISKWARILVQDIDIVYFELSLNHCHEKIDFSVDY